MASLQGRAATEWAEWQIRANDREPKEKWTRVVDWAGVCVQWTR